MLVVVHAETALAVVVDVHVAVPEDIRQPHPLLLFWRIVYVGTSHDASSQAGCEVELQWMRGRFKAAVELQCHHLLVVETNAEVALYDVGR